MSSNKNNNKNKSHGGKRLGEGNYGCTVSPAYKCKSNINPQTNASKLSDKNSQQNPEIFKYIRNIKNYKNHFVIPFENCLIHSKNINIDDKRECENINLFHNKKFINSIMIKGDYNLYETPKININTTIKYLLQLLKSTDLLVKHNIAHLDIKSLNILIRKNNAYFIDFDDIFCPTNWDEFTYFIDSFTHMKSHYIWPPEIYFQFDKFLSSMPTYIVDYLNSITTQFINEKQILLSYKQFIEKIMIYLLATSFYDIYDVIIDNKNKKLKNLLDLMASNNPDDRPSIKYCIKYLKKNFTNKSPKN